MKNSDAVSVLLADDQVALRAAVKRVLERDGFRVCAEVAAAEEAIVIALRERPDLCLIDVDLPGDGIRAAAEIRGAVPSTRVVMLTGARDDVHLFRALRAGAEGYLLKDTDPDRLPHALRGVLAGEAAVPRDLMARVLAEFRKNAPRRHVSFADGRGTNLTDREWEVLELMRAGLTTAAIAERLFVTPVTVRRHISSIVSKLGVEGREEALALATQAG